MQPRVLMFRLVKHSYGISVSTNRFLSGIASQAPPLSNTIHHTSIQTKPADTVKKEWIRFSNSDSNQKSSATPIDVESLILFEDNHLLVLLKPNMTLIQGDVGGSSNLLDSAKQFLVQRNKKPGEAFLGTRDKVSNKWYLN